MELQPLPYKQLVSQIGDLLAIGREKAAVQVEAELPDGSGEDKKLYGRLVYDEAETGAGLRVVIFQPVENGAPVDDVQLVIPTMYISKWNGRETD